MKKEKKKPRLIWFTKIALLFEIITIASGISLTIYTGSKLELDTITDVVDYTVYMSSRIGLIVLTIFLLNHFIKHGEFESLEFYGLKMIMKKDPKIKEDLEALTLIYDHLDETITLSKIAYTLSKADRSFSDEEFISQITLITLSILGVDVYIDSFKIDVNAIDTHTNEQGLLVIINQQRYDILVTGVTLGKAEEVLIKHYIYGTYAVLMIDKYESDDKIR